MSITSVTVYAASSRALATVYVDAARRLGQTLARQGLEIVYGGGGAGLMGAMADGALAAGGRVHGVIPDFLQTVEAGHERLTSLEVVTDMRIRKARMLERGEAVVALPGGCGTFEELFEAMTLKRLGQYSGAIVLVNTGGFYNRLLDFLEHSVNLNFMSPAHLSMWQCVDQPEDVPAALGNAAPWRADALQQAAVRRPAGV